MLVADANLPIATPCFLRRKLIFVSVVVVVIVVPVVL